MDKPVFDKQWVKDTLMRKCINSYGVPIEEASNEQKYKLLALTVRDEIMQKLAFSTGRRKQAGARKVYYLCAEFLIGRLMSNNILNLCNIAEYNEACQELGIDINDLEIFEPEPGLGNGGLGRLSACFLDSLTSMSLPAMGCSIRYEFGLFRQRILNGEQVEMPDSWLDNGNAWEIPMPEDECEVHFYGRVEEDWSSGKLKCVHKGYSTVIASPYDIPVVGYDTDQVNRLRLWSAKAPERINMRYFNEGEYARMMDESDLAEVLSKVLYPEDRHIQGKELRLRQHYFLASATMQFIIKDYMRVYGSDLRRLPDYVCVQINDTHPALAIPELMRLLMDEHGLSWEDAEFVCRRTFSYTNHTVLAEALERWDENIFKHTLPRIYTILKEMNERLCKKLWNYYPNQWEKIAHMAILSYGHLNMANLCVEYCGTVNGVSQLHAEILKKDTFHDYYLITPEKFTGITNGITHRRWLMEANPKLAALIDEAIGDGWRKQPEQLELLLPFAKDKAFLDRYGAVKQDNKERFAKYILQSQNEMIDPSFIFDVHAKRIHEYKRQLLNILHVLHLYNRLKTDSTFKMTPRVYIFSGKAAPGYVRAKLIIKLINEVGRMINADPVVSKSLRVVFMENYNVSKAERLIPAANVSEQISTAGKEASGTGNMKFMQNGALTCGTLDGANVEITQLVGRENIYLFGLTAEEVESHYQHGTYKAGELYSANPDIRRLMEQLINGTVGREQQFADLYQSLLFGSYGSMADPYFVLKDFASYQDVQRRIGEEYLDTYTWLEKAVINTAKSGFFASDRAISEYNERIWHLSPIK